MRTFNILAAPISAAPVSNAETTVAKPSEVRAVAEEELYQQWQYQHAIAGMVIADLKAQRGSALLEPDQQFHPEHVPGYTRTPPEPLKQLRPQLASKYKSRDAMDEKYRRETRALATNQ